MLANGEYVDGSWLLTIHIDDLNIDRQIRVHGEWSISELLIQLTDGLTCPLPKPIQPNEISLRSGIVRNNWNDYGLWWPNKLKWLLKTKSSLNQYGLQADAKLHFISIYGNLNIQLPDLQIRNFIDVNYAEPVFRVTLSICRYLNIRHPEELSLAHSIHQNDLKYSRSIDKRYHTLFPNGKYSTFQRNATINTTHSQYKTLHHESLFQMNNTININQQDKIQLDSSITRKNSSSSSSSSSTTKNSLHLFGPPRIRDKRIHHYITNSNCYSRLDYENYNNKITLSPITFNLRILDDITLAYSPLMNVNDVLKANLIVRPNNFLQRLRLNTIWLDSSKSLMEQGIYMLDYLSLSLHNRSNSPLSTQNDNQTKLPHNNVNNNNNNNNKDEYTIPTLLLRYKYGTFYDLNVKYDLIRINQLYEQAKWSIISEIYEVTDEEACLFAALQAQIELSTDDETLINNEELLHNNVINDTFNTNDTQQLMNTKKIQSTLIINNNRDISPLGGYLHTKRYLTNSIITSTSSSSSSTSSPTTITPTSTRPQSIIELDNEIDIMLNELSINCLKSTNINLLSDNINIQHSTRSRSRRLKFNLQSYYGKLIDYETNGSCLINKEDSQINSDTVEVIYLPGCEIQPDLCISSEKFNIRLYVPVSRTNLPLSAAFANTSQLDDLQTDEDGDTTVGTKLKRRASLLSLTSLAHLSNVLGISSSSSSSTSTHNGAQNGLIGINGMGALTGSSAAMTGLVNELWLRFLNIDDYIDWLAIFHLTDSSNTTLLKSTTLSKKSHNITSYLLNRTTFNAERKAISNLLRLLSPNSMKSDQIDEIVNITRLHNHLDKRLIDMLPLRLSYMKSSHKTWDYRREQYDTLLKRSTTLSNHEKSSIYSQTNQFQQTRNNLIQRISSMYTQINKLTSLQGKLKYINAWEQLHLHGIAFFTARIEVTVPLNALINTEHYIDSNNEQIGLIPGINRSTINNHITISISRKIEAIGISSTRIYRCDLTNGEILASWRMSSIQGWHINWELSELILILANQSQCQSKTSTNTTTTTTNMNNSSKTDHHHHHQSMMKSHEFSGRVIIRPVDVSVRTIAEFLGGYTFLNLRSPEKNQCLAEDVFYKLTTGMSLPSI
ncbi:hypothetical protein MN116_008080 [Schistosoma mekongi]|uniref:Band 4.1 domain-containing protein n=1 Tax=Schistosoma mekongi TaxID=38744 RepID=A0AAE1Z720_SCHME|nr:hypothetical protein MN116_008080 [Schistosoma mekongi]